MLPRLCPSARPTLGRRIQYKFTRHRVLHTSTLRLSPATAALSSSISKRPAETTVSPRVAARNILKSVIELIPRTLAPKSQKIWENRVRNAFDDLEPGKIRPTRITIWGDQVSGASEIITALLDDPLSSDLSQREMIHRRWESNTPLTNTIRIRNGESTSRNGSILTIKSSWLQKLNAELVECRGVEAYDTLLSTDHVIIVTDNVRLLSAPGVEGLLRKFSQAPSVHVLVSERAPGISSQNLGDIVPNIVKPDEAVRGLNAFTQGNINQYQSLLVDSGIPRLAQQISRWCTESAIPSSPSSSASVSVVRTAAHTARAALAACDQAITDVQTQLSTTASSLVPFKDEVAAVYPNTYRSALRGTTTVREGVAAAEQRLRAAFGRLPWYSLWWRADEVSGTLGEAISWGSLGAQFAFQAGRLSSIRQQLYLKATAFASSSPVLSNQLAQIDSRTPVGPDALSVPFNHRTSQLLAPGGPMEYVHRKAQNAVLKAAVNIFGSGIVAAGLFATGTTGAGTAVGVGLLGSLASVRWMQSVWAQTEKRWWADWARVCAGLERDCEAALQEVVHERVTGVAIAGIEGVEAIVARRVEIVSALRGEVQELSQQLSTLEKRLK